MYVRTSGHFSVQSVCGDKISTTWILWTSSVSILPVRKKVLNIKHIISKYYYLQEKERREKDLLEAEIQAKKLGEERKQRV